MSALISLGTIANASIQKRDFEPNLGQRLLRQIVAEKDPNFSGLFSDWKKQHGVSAVKPLLEIAEDKALSEKTRTIALLGAAELSKTQPDLSKNRILPLLKDSQWLIRISAIKGLEILSARSVTLEIAERLRDPALVVRSQAADTLLRLSQSPQNEFATQPRILRALSEAMLASENYSDQKALWVPQKALAALVASGAKSELKQIAKLLDRKADPKMVQLAIFALEKISGAKPGQRTAEQWKKQLAEKG
ncbi:MAG: hypothetical protein KGQ59_01690 [Bdellovibrionales bacterium]|nr:hypothetical protein [Bdellovibrionales bacterium]